MLFSDKRLSRDGAMSCATCHDPGRAFSEARPIAIGVGGARGSRNAPALINRGYGQSFFWDGRTESLERQVLEPITNPKELALTVSEIEQRTGHTPEDVAFALASYVRTIRSGNSRFDRFIAGDRNALTATERAGFELFRGKANCSSCHSGPNFTDERFHNTGVAWDGERLKDEGQLRGSFKTPTLREVANTAPYMHDGSLATLDDVIEFYSGGGRPNPWLDTEIQRRNFAASEKAALVAFLHALSGSVIEGWSDNH
jgi:cytochrome c peroxidase